MAARRSWSTGIRWQQGLAPGPVLVPVITDVAGEFSRHPDLSSVSASNIGISILHMLTSLPPGVASTSCRLAPDSTIYITKTPTGGSALLPSLHGALRYFFVSYVLSARTFWLHVLLLFFLFFFILTPH